jgi:TolB-like protein/thioredoxin-like negative regulator of GroEL
MAEDSPKSGEGKQTVPAEMPHQDAGSHDVFISYASQDAVIANAVVTALERASISCWIAPRDVVPGSLYADEIVGAINDAKAVVLVLSQHSVASPHVGKEIERASSKRRRIIAFHTDSAPLTRGFEYFLSESQWIDVGAGGMDAAIAKLVEAVRRHLDPSAAIESRRARPDPPTTAPIARVLRKRWVAAGGAILLVAIAYFGVEKFWMSKRIAEEKPVAAAPPATVPALPAIPEKSIAVLPFVDMSEKKDQEYFSDGMAEEVLDLLAQIPDVQVIGRTSSFQFKGQNADLRTVGAKLNAAYVVEGSVRRSGDHLRVTAQLIDSRTGEHVWSESFDRRIDDALKVQDDIAAGLVRALQISIGADELRARPAIRNVRAYSLYLRGRHALDRLDEEGFAQSAGLFQQAIDLDPTLTPAAAWLALAYEVQGEWGFVVPTIAFENARRAAESALKVDPNSFLPYAVLGAVHTVYDWDWAAGDAVLKRALALAPHEPAALFFAARSAMIVGRYDEALALIQATLARDPLMPYGHMGTCWIQQRRGHLPEAEAGVRRALEISPTFVSAHFYLGLVLLARGEREAALAAMRAETEAGGQLGGLAMAYFALGRKKDSDAALARLTRVGAEAAAFSIAEVYAYRGEYERAIQWLERAYAQRDPGLYAIKGDPPLKSLEGDPRFKAFLRKMNLPD